MALTRHQLFPKLLALCTHLLSGQKAHAADEAEDVWTDFLVHHAGGLRSDAAAVAYLRIMAIRRCRRRRELTERQGTLAAEPAAPDEGPERKLIAKDEASRLEQCLSRLDPRARQLVRMKYSHGMTQEAIGDTLGFSKQYAGRVLQKALDALRQCIEVAS